MGDELLNKSQKPQILVITGISGAGRSTVANVLEDEGWYVIDNIPPQMLESIAELVTQDGAKVPKVALGIDVRARAVFDDLPAAIETLRKLTLISRCSFETPKMKLSWLAMRHSVAPIRFKEKVAYLTVYVPNVPSSRGFDSPLTARLIPRA